MSRDLVVIGAGGHAKVVIATAQAAGRNVTAVYDDDKAKWGTSILDVSVRGPVNELASSTGFQAVIAIGDNATRMRLARELHCSWASIIHPSAHVHESVTIRDGAVVFAGCVIQPHTEIGSHAIVNTAATVDHDCVVGDFSHLAPGCNLAGGVTLGEGCFFGIGSAAVPNVEVGEWTTVGAGGVVTANLPSHVVAVGVPARPRKT